MAESHCSGECALGNNRKLDLTQGDERTQAHISCISTVMSAH